MYGWIIGGLAGLDLGIKSVIEKQDADTFPRELIAARGMIQLHKNHNHGFPFGFLREKPELVKAIPLMVISAMAGALGAFMTEKGRTLEKLGLSIALGGAVSNLYDRLVRGYVVDYFSIEWKRLKKVVFNLGDMFVFLGSAVFIISQAVGSLKRGWLKRHFILKVLRLGYPLGFRGIDLALTLSASSAVFAHLFSALPVSLFLAPVFSPFLSVCSALSLGDGGDVFSSSYLRWYLQGHIAP
ncbi:signal peptidase II [Clostridium porci]|uniref:signal peptidase II n=1 Tax=Clostridium porci TaxID=2605778 RepID=UPI003A91A9F7